MCDKETEEGQGTAFGHEEGCPKGLPRAWLCLASFRLTPFASYRYNCSGIMTIFFSFPLTLLFFFVGYSYFICFPFLSFFPFWCLSFISFSFSFLSFFLYLYFCLSRLFRSHISCVSFVWFFPSLPRMFSFLFHVFFFTFFRDFNCT